MKVISSKDELRQVVIEARRSGRAIGFVPTVGFLHEGHMSLMQRLQAPVLYRSLCNVEKKIMDGERQAALLRKRMETEIEAVGDAVIDYVSIVNAQYP